MEPTGIWIIVDQADGELTEVTLEMLGEGRKLADKRKEEVCAILLGYQIAGLVDTLAQYGADKVYLSEHPALEEYNSDAYTVILTDLINTYLPNLVMLGATSSGRDQAPRIATRLKLALVSDCTQVRSARGVWEITKPVYGGKFYATMTCPATQRLVVTIKPGAIGVGAPNNPRKAQLVTVETRIDAALRAKAGIINRANPKTLDIAEADLVVAGGRGVGGQEKWHIVEELADSLGASVAGTRTAMDMNCIPRGRLVGQTGKVISPKLYFAVGISGAAQHTAGMKNAKCIITINTDQYAPIFGLAHMAIVADLNEVIPAILKELRKSGADLDGKRNDSQTKVTPG